MERSPSRMATGTALGVGGAMTAVLVYMNRGHDLSSEINSELRYLGISRATLNEIGGFRARVGGMNNTQKTMFFSAVGASITGSLLATVWSRTPVYASINAQGATAGGRLTW